jgi:enoyl-CoA hydratase/carnithine racemase
MSHLEYGIDDGLAVLVLNNPPQNRIGLRLVKELAEAIEAIGKQGARAVLLRAAGTDFSFGGDIQPWPDWDVHELRTNFEKFMAMHNRFERLRIPVIAAVNGNCFGGLELVLRSDVVFAGRSAQFCHPEQTLGIVTLLGGVQRMAERVGHSRAMEWALNSERVGAERLQPRPPISGRVTGTRTANVASRPRHRRVARPRTVIAGHKRPDRADDPKIVE